MLGVLKVTHCSGTPLTDDNSLQLVPRTVTFFFCVIEYTLTSAAPTWITMPSPLAAAGKYDGMTVLYRTRSPISNGLFAIWYK
jgi:hypothetical protein